MQADCPTRPAVVLGAPLAVAFDPLDGDVGFWPRQLRHAPVRNIDLVYARMCDRHAWSALYQNPIDSPIFTRSKRLILVQAQRDLVAYVTFIRHKPTQDDPLVLNRHCLCMYIAHCQRIIGLTSAMIRSYLKGDQGGETMNICTVTRVVMCAALVTGCVSSGTHEETVAQLEEARKGAAQSAAAFESYKKQTAAEADSLKNQLADVNARIAALMSGTTTAQDEIARLQKRAGELEAETARANDLVKQLSEREQDLNERLKNEAAEKARLEKERAAKEAEIQRLTQTHAELKIG